ncbi:MAG: AbrB/MazE/SpoVT family DNA-binding domain-containing protein [Hyphomicrobiales bacterium]|nr:AbrB/MazE/SpoVT family DNA-binding domain-containing protein [Hyphomicrobiales bacterium]
MGVSAKISSKYKISIPKEVCERLGWKPGQECVFVPHGKGVVLMPRLDIDSLRGMAKGADPGGYRDRDDRY